MRYQPLPATFHTGNRATLAAVIGDDAIAVIDTAGVLRRPGDFEYPFRPDSNFYYLTGIDQPEAVLVLVPGHANPAMRELLFLRQTNDFIAQWEGDRYTLEEAAGLSGIKQVFWLDGLTPILSRLTTRHQTIYLNADSSLEGSPPSPSLVRARRLRDDLPLHQLRSVLPQLARQRTVKQPVEIEQIRRAIEVTGAGLSRAWQAVKPGVREYELEAELAGEYLRRGATGHGFYPIVATGPSATVMHYTHMDAELAPNQLVLFDTGAEAGWYAADISRAVPVSGRFTDRTRAIYEAVLRVQRAGISLHKPGTNIVETDSHMRELLREELVTLKLITAAQAKSAQADIPKLFTIPHSSHHIGLDVHDVGDPHTPFEPGMVVTCEPGLYIKEEGIGVRLEDNILITETGHEVLSAGIPTEPAAIEAAMRGRAK